MIRLIIVFCFLSIFSFSQEKSFDGHSIFVEARSDPGSGYNKFKLFITFDEKDFSVEYKMSDGFSLDNFRSDQKFRIALDYIKDRDKKNKDSLKYYENLIFKNADVGMGFKSKTIKYTYNQNPKYLEILENLLDSNAEIKVGDFGILLHGISFNIDISDSKNIRKINLSSPSPDRFPLIYDFIVETFNLYRSRFKDDFLHPLRTMNY